ncbi:MAG: hypothetical protein MUO50_04785 [Longimicrobiales bacterium]|nr:hypothetical protein [Longimicrobiales bacterium]
MTPAEIAELRKFIAGELRKVHDRVDQVYAGLLAFQEQVAGHFGTVYTRLDDVTTRLSRVETQFEEMRSDFRAFGEELRSTNRREEELRSDMNSWQNPNRTHACAP